MRFAERTDFGGGESAYGVALRETRTRGDLLDLTASNPTKCGLPYPEDHLLQALSDPLGMRYDADPLGLLSAREAIATLYRNHYGSAVDAAQVLLTASTSEAYGFLLRLLCNSGDHILVPSPSYPLFDLIARLHDVQLVPYPLVYHDGWQIDASSLAVAVTERTRAIIAIHPNNPTGHFCGDADRATLFAVAQQIGLPLIIDEVFFDYPLETKSVQSFASLDAPVPTFVLGGLSKLLALPQMKVAWTVVCGPSHQAASAMEKLEIIADTFLSVATPQQVALPAWLREREIIQSAIQQRTRENLATLDAIIAQSPVSRLRVEGGWAAVLRVPALEPDGDFAVRLLKEAGVAIHPGSLYGFPGRGWLVVSLLTPPDRFCEGLTRLLHAIE